MSKEKNQTAAATGESNILDENKPKLVAIPQKYCPRDETDAQLKAFIDELEFLRRIPVSRRTLFSWVQSGKIPCVKIGRRKIYHWASCEAALLRLQRGAE
jgi:hypothetical protein